MVCLNFTPERFKEPAQDNTMEVMGEHKAENSVAISEEADIDDKLPDQSNKKQNYIKVVKEKRGTRPSLKKKISRLTSRARY